MEVFYLCQHALERNIDFSFMDNHISLPAGKKIYFASDFHLGAPNHAESLKRERRIVSWLDEIKQDATHIFLIGDLFDFWFEYKWVIPKGFVRLQGKLAEITDSGIPVTFYTGNHDMWMFGYFEQELGVSVKRLPESYKMGNHSFYVGHGDGLGPGDKVYKFLKRVFESPFFQWVFQMVPPVIGMGIAHAWSRQSRHANTMKEGENVENTDPKKEWLWIYSQEIEQALHHDYYVFGHRHKPLDLALSEKSRYINTGEWISQFTYAVYDGEQLKLSTFPSSQ